eukprot:gene11145-1945_t
MLANKDRFFPTTIAFRSREGWEEERELFGRAAGAGRGGGSRPPRWPPARGE